MAYEIEFVGNSEVSKDATAICFRWKDSFGKFATGVFDGGTSELGGALKRHMETYYYDNSSGKTTVDFVICSHPHEDHASGLKEILENLDVKALYMNRPWNHIDELFNRVSDGRITKNSLARRLKEDYHYIADLEDIANEKNIPIYDAFEGDTIGGKLTVLSPSKEFYLDLIAEDQKDIMKKSNPVSELFSRVVAFVKNIAESWTDEKLRENVSTDPINETSTVLLGRMDDEQFLLTGDVGIKGLRNAIDYADSIFNSLKDKVKIYEMPHHGGRHNVSPSILNDLVGKILNEGDTNGKAAYACVGKGSDHPKKMVVNAFIRRGAATYKTNGTIIWHHVGDMPEREGWVPVSKLGFSTTVEDWED